MQSDTALPPALATWARQHARTGVRYSTAAAVWQAADRAHPGLLPTDPQPPPQDRPNALEPVPVVLYTATIITLDGSDTTAYGEACEPGHGYTERSGWWEPDRAYWRVREHRTEVTPDVYPPDEPLDPARWLAAQLTARLGTVESFDHGRTFYGAHEAVHPGRLTDLAAGPTAADRAAAHTVAAIRMRIGTRGQRTLTAAGHAHGFTAAHLADAAALLGLG